MVSTPPKLLLKHEKLSASEARKVAEKYRTPLDKFPRMLENDPQATKIGAKPGDLVAIHREEPHGGAYTYYRLVVK